MKQKDRGLRRGQGYTDVRTDPHGVQFVVARWREGDRYRSRVFRDPDPTTALEAAEQHVREMDRAQRSGRYIPPSELTVIDIVNQYLVRGESRWSPNTYSTYGHRIRSCIEPKIGNLRIHTLDTGRVQHWVDGLVREGWSAEVVTSASLILSAACKEAVRLGIMPTNPALGIRRPRIVRKQHVVWTAAEARLAIAEVTDEPRWNAVYRLALATGMRPGELRALKWRDIDLDPDGGAVVTIRRTMTKDRLGRPTLGTDTKTGGARQIAIPESVTVALRRWRVEQKTLRLRSETWTDVDAVFTGRGGGHLSLSSWQKRHEKLCLSLLERTGNFPRPTLHELRHTAATLMLANNVHVKIVADILGHRKIETTLNIYQHVSADMQRAASEQLDASLNTTTSPRNTPKSG